MAQAALLGHVLPRQLSFKAALQLIRAFEENLRHAPRGRLDSYDFDVSQKLFNNYAASIT